MSIAEIAKSVSVGKTTAEELVTKSLANAKKHQKHNAIIEISEHALTKAKQLDQQIKKGRTGRLLGVPFVAKDNFLTFNTETTAASNILKGFKAPYQSTAIERLEAEGAIMVAKGNLDAFGHGASTEHSDFGPTKNPHDESRVAGGSSGGPAAAVALDIAAFALGTDTGGSIRQPASFSGVVGYKPTYGLVSRFGVIAMASSTDVVGPMTRSVADAALVLDVIAGKDSKDSTTIDRERTYEISSSKSKPKVALVKEFMGDGVDKSVKQKILDTAVLLKKSGVDVAEISLPSLDLALACYYIIVPAEISSNLARYDGIKFGYSHDSSKNLDEVYDLSRSFGFGAEAKRRIMIGTYVLSSGYYEAYYKKAMQVRTLLIQDFTKAFNSYDYLIGPVAPTPAFKLGENLADPLQMYLADVMTVGASLAGLPAISVPVDQVSKLPVGLQIMGKQGNDSGVLRLASLVESLGAAND